MVKHSCKAFTWSGNPCKNSANRKRMVEHRSEMISVCGIHFNSTRLELERPSEQVLEARRQLDVLEQQYLADIAPYLSKIEEIKAAYKKDRRPLVCESQSSYVHHQQHQSDPTEGNEANDLQ